MSGQTDSRAAEQLAEGTQPKVRWWLAGALTLGGFVVIALGYLFAHGVIPLGAKDESYVSSVAVNIGTTFLLAAALVLFERALVFTAQREVRKATAPIRAEVEAARAESQIVREENVQLTERTAVLESRLLDLDEQLRARADAEAREQARSFVSLGESVNRATVIDIMDAASKIDALANHFHTGRSGQVTVPAGIGVDAPRITLQYARFEEDDWNTAEIPTLALTVVGLEDETLAWEEGDAPLDVFTRIRGLMIRRGEAKRSGPLSPTEFFQNLRSTVEQATLSRSAIEGGWLTVTPVFEMVAQDWIITAGGVEVRSRGTVIRPDQYPHNVPGAERTSNRVGKAPADLDEETWNYAAERGIGYFTGPPETSWVF